MFLVFVLGFVLLIPLAAALLAHRNLRAGRGDRRGASKIAVVVGGLSLLGWLFGVHHAMSPAEFLPLVSAVGTALLWAAMAWVGYLAVEPLFRRHWPKQLVSWSRLLEGRFRDPLVSRHLLLGILVATLLSTMSQALYFVFELSPSPDIYLLGFARLQAVGMSITIGLVLASLLAVSHFFLRRRRLSVTGTAVRSPGAA